MMTGVFFHQEFSFKDGPIVGNKFRNFPAAMQKVLSKEGVVLFEPKPATDEMLLRVHTKSYLKEVKQAWYDKRASLAEEVKKCTEEVCEGHTLIITHGGYLREVAEYIFPNIVEILIRP